MKKQPDKTGTQDVRFRTNVLLKSVIGRDLINDDNIAVLELVKNAYDARATNIGVCFEGLSGRREQSRLIIRDNGKGMSDSDVRDKWLNIAYSEKRNVQQGAKGQRAFAGNKGVGRFSCDRLGEKLDLYSRSKGESIVHLDLDWTDFEVEDQEEGEVQIQDIEIKLSTLTDAEFKRVTKLESLETGTVLDIRRLRAPWDYHALLSLRRSLERFINPNQIFDKTGLKIELLASDFDDKDKGQPRNKRVSGRVENQIFSKLDFHATSVESEMSSDGKTTSTTLRHGGKEVYALEEENDLHAELSDAKVVIYFLNQYKKAYFRRQTGQASIDFGSVFLFVNGFRIAPYGDRGNDWLQIDNRKQQQMMRHLGTRDIVGRIELVDRDAKFRPVSSREGLVINQAVFQLVDPEKGFFQRAFRRLEKYVVDGLGWDALSDQGKQELRDADSDDKKPLRLQEKYVETEETKNARIAGQIHSILVAPRKIVSLKFDPAVVRGIAEQERESLEKIVAGFEKYDAKVMDSNLGKTLSRVREVLRKQEQKLEVVEGERKTLSHEVAHKAALISALEEREVQKEGQILFLKSIGSRDLDNVVLLHHQIGISSSTIDNYLQTLTRALNGEGPIDKAKVAHAVERISFENKKILAISRFATKANFRMDSQTIVADLVPFVAGYVQNVSQDFAGSGLKIHVDTQGTPSFERKFKPIELTIVLDNILTNARKAAARSVTLSLSKTRSGLELRFEDDGRGLPGFLKPEEYDRVFEKGFTTTDGSGLGLYHVHEIIKAMDGSISAENGAKRGAVVTIRIPK